MGDKKKQLKEILLAISCLINCSTAASEACEIMDILENYAGSSMPKWKKYKDVRYIGTRNAAKNDLRKLLKAF